MAFVLDASAALPWCFRDEATAQTDLFLARAIRGERIYVPAHWAVEILNGLTRAMRRGRVHPAEVDFFLGWLPDFDIVVDLQPIEPQWAEALPLIRRHRLSAYDAAYLSLAKRLSVPLATFDDQLRAAALAEGIPLEV
jgi:predicted nucleic acid-binding protein